MPRVRLSQSATITPSALGVLLRSDLGMFQLQDAHAQMFANAMVPLLDGSKDKEAIAAALGQFSRQSVLAFLELLEQQGLVEPVPDESGNRRWSGQEAFFRKWTDQSEELARRLRMARVLVAGLEPWGVVAVTELAASGVGALHLLDDGQITADDLLLVRTWNSHHVGRSRASALVETLAEAAPWCGVTAGSPPLSDDRDSLLHDAHWDLIIGAFAADELRLLRFLAGYAQRAGVQSLFGYIDGLDAVVGPAVVPGQTACWNCARLRQLAHADHLEEAHSLHTALLAERPRPRSRTYLAPMAALAGQLLALEAIKITSRYAPSQLFGRLLVQNLVTLETSLHTVIRMPWCEVCGGAASGGPPPGGPRIARDSSGEPQRGQTSSVAGAADPAELRKLLAGWVDARTGVIKHLAIGSPQATEPELPVTSAAVLASYTEGVFRPSDTVVGSGKGLTAVDAMVGAVGEAIERYSSARYREDNLYRSALNDLHGEFLDPRRLSLYSDVQYDRPGFPFVRFDPSRPIDWTRGYWLDTGEPVWMPALMTYFVWAGHGEEFCQITSSGLAAGAGLEDAAQRAVLELVERDALMITWLAQRPGRRVQLDEALDPGAHEVVRQLGERGVQVEVFWLEVGLSIATMMCLGVGDGKRWPGVTVAMAAHPNPRLAARKAILEQGHVGPFLARLMRGGGRSVPTAPNEVRTLVDHALYYVPVERTRIFDFLRHHGTETIPLAELPVPLDCSLAASARRLQQSGTRVAIADVTSPDVAESPFRVARALGIGLQPIDFGFGLQRLPTPRLLGALNGRSGLNPHPHPLA